MTKKKLFLFTIQLWRNQWHGGSILGGNVTLGSDEPQPDLHCWLETSQRHPLSRRSRGKTWEEVFEWPPLNFSAEKKWQSILRVASLTKARVLILNGQGPLDMCYYCPKLPPSLFILWVASQNGFHWMSDTMMYMSGTQSTSPGAPLTFCRDGGII